jgi:hypothetical protein
VVHVEADHIDQLLLESWVVGDFEGLDLPRLQVVVVPDAGDRVLADPDLGGEPARRPVGETSSGFSCWVSLKTSATVPAGSDGLRPRPLAITSMPSTPFSAKRVRQRRIASESTPERRAISWLLVPSPAHSKARA